MFTRILVTLAFVGVVRTALAEPHAQPTLIANGDMEAGTGTPAGWTTSADIGICTQTWSSEAGYAISGHRALKMVMVTNGQCDWRQHLAIDGHVRYRMRAHIFASAVGGTHSVELQWFQGSTYIRRDIMSAPVANLWKEVYGEDIQPPPNADSVYLLLRTYKTGIYYFDDVVLVRKDENVWPVAGSFPIGVYGLPATRLLNNGDFEEAPGCGTFEKQTALNGAPPPASGGAPALTDSASAFWRRHTDSGTAVQTWVQIGTKSTGAPERALKTQMLSAGQSDWRQYVPRIDPNLRYRLSAVIKADNVVSNSHSVEAQWFDANGFYISRNRIAATVANTAQPVSLSGIVPPPNAASVWVLLRTYQVGTYVFHSVAVDVDMTLFERMVEAKAAGFKILRTTKGTELDDASAAGIAAFYIPPRPIYSTNSSLVDQVNAVESKPALSIWHGIDEPAWSDPVVKSDGTLGCTHYCTMNVCRAATACA